jgi:sporulation protein YlmC with PRC-barrel domain
MRKISVLSSMLLLLAMILAACGGGATSTNVVESPPPVTADSTDDLSGTPTDAPTEAATEPGTTTETPGVPVTGGVNPARISNQLDFTVWSQNGEQIGEVDDMVLNLDNSRIAYVVVGTGGFLDLGERDILVPSNSLQLQTGTGETTGGQQNVFILQTDLDVFQNAPDFDLGANLPQVGQPAGDWDIDIRTYWESGGTTGGTANTAVPDMTATGTTTDTAQVTATSEAGVVSATPSPDQGTGENQIGGQALQGVVLATEVLGSTITLSPGEGQGQGQGQATAEPSATTDPNATMDPNATATTEPGTGQGVGNIEGTIDDMIVAIDTGDIQYIVVDVTLDETQRWIPVPLSFIEWNAANGTFLINANPSTFRDAPFFENGQYPDTTVSGWNSEFDAFWQNSGSGGPEAQATATP